MGYKLGSLFDGSGTCPLAATLCGIEPVWASEIEPYPIKVTTARFPAMQHLGDITKIDGAAIPPVDIITFGSPCQDLSVAGRRAGLQEGERSSLFYEAIRIIREMRAATNGKYPRFAIWENVPGAFSSNKGQDFRCVIEAFLSLAETRLPAAVPMPDRGRWPRAGVVVDEGFSLAWRTLDARFWGVPQRRRRIYLVADFAGGRAGEVLFEREGLRGDHPSCGAAREGAAADAAGGAGGSGEPLSTIDARNLRLNHQVSGTLQAKPNGGFSYNYLNPVLYPALAISSKQQSLAVSEEASGTLGANDYKEPQAVVYPTGPAPSLCARADSSPCVDRGQPFVAYESGQGYWMPGFGWLRAQGGGSPSHCVVDGPPVACYDARGNGDGTVAATMTGDHESDVSDYTNVVVGAFSGGQGEKAGGIGYAENIAPSLKAADSGSNQVPDVVYALQGNGIDRADTAGCNGAGVKEDTSYTLNTVDRHGVAYPDVFHSLTATNARCAESAQQPNCAVYRQVSHGEFETPDDTASAIKARDFKGGTVDVCLSTLRGRRKWIVRRLTPLECCRLQGFPDWWEDGVKGADSARYKMWGNGMAFPCVLYVMQGVKEALVNGR